MKRSVENIIKSYGVAKSIKDSWDNGIYKYVFEVFMPSRDRFNEKKSEDKSWWTDRRAHVYSSLPEQSADEFVNRIQELMFPPQSDWIELEAGVLIDEDKKEGVNEQLKKVSDIANEIVKQSGFDMALSEFAYDLIAGTACMLVTEGTPENPVTFKAIPLDEFCIEEGVDNQVSCVYRKFKLDRETIKYQWKEIQDDKAFAVTEDNRDEKIEIIECCYKDYDTSKWYYCVIQTKEAHQLVERTYDNSPFVVMRWNKCAGEIYGRGVGVKALNDARSHNLMRYYWLRAMAFLIPTLLADSNDVDIDDFIFEAGAINSVEDPDRSIKQLEMNVNFQENAVAIDSLAMEVKKAMGASMLPESAQREQTATEIVKRSKDEFKQQNSMYGRTIFFQQSLIKSILQSMRTYVGDFDYNLINGYMYKIKINTPLSRGLNLTKAQSIVESIQAFLALDPSGQELYSTVNMDKEKTRLAHLLGFSPDAIWTDEQKKQNQEQQAQAQQAQQAQAISDEIQVEAGKEQAKANVNTL